MTRRRRLLSATSPDCAIDRREQVRAVERILASRAAMTQWSNGRRVHNLDGVIWFSK